MQASSRLLQNFCYELEQILPAPSQSRKNWCKIRKIERTTQVVQRILSLSLGEEFIYLVLQFYIAQTRPGGIRALYTSTSYITQGRYLGSGRLRNLPRITVCWANAEARTWFSSSKIGSYEVTPHPLPLSKTSYCFILFNQYRERHKPT